MNLLDKTFKKENIKYRKLGQKLVLDEKDCIVINIEYDTAGNELPHVPARLRKRASKKQLNSLIWRLNKIVMLCPIQYYEEGLSELMASIFLSQFLSNNIDELKIVVKPRRGKRFKFMTQEWCEGMEIAKRKSLLIDAGIK